MLLLSIHRIYILTLKKYEYCNNHYHWRNRYTESLLERSNVTLGSNLISNEICTLRILDLEEFFWLYRVLLNTCTQVCFMVERPMVHYLYRRPCLYFDRMFEKFLSFCTWSHLICFCRDSLLIYFAFYVLREVLM